MGASDLHYLCEDFLRTGRPKRLSGRFWKIIAVWEGGIAIYGAIIGAVIVGVTYCKAKKLDMGTVFDVCAPGLMIGQIIGPVGQFCQRGGVRQSDGLAFCDVNQWRRRRTALVFV